jgi:hypothetical protein
MGDCTIPSWEYHRPGFEWPCPYLGEEEEGFEEDTDDGPQIVLIDIPFSEK